MPMGGLAAPGCTVTLVIVTRRDEEFSGKSNCSDRTPELDSVVIDDFRKISICPRLQLAWISSEPASGPI